jgi:hypothetical protein
MKLPFVTTDITFYEEKGEKISKNTYKDKKECLTKTKNLYTRGFYDRL